MADIGYDESVNAPAYWLGRANSARTAAKATEDARMRTHLIGSAEGYEKIARYLAAQIGHLPEIH
jgi:hypothetical protein